MFYKRLCLIPREVQLVLLHWAVRMKFSKLANIIFYITVVVCLIMVMMGFTLRDSDVKAGDRYVSSSMINKEIRPNCPITLVNSDEEFLNYFQNLTFKCKKWKSFGLKEKSGIKYMCLDPKFNIQPGNCHVLSFGINNEWSFDDDMDKFNCKVYAYDPTMGKEDHQRSPNIQFFKLGLGSIQGKQIVGMKDKFNIRKVDRYENILKSIGLLDTPIDYIKMDIEKSELDFFMDLFIRSPHLLKNIKQIGMEVHHDPTGIGLGHDSLFQQFWVAFQLLECHGFKLAKVYKWSMKMKEVVWIQDADW